MPLGVIELPSHKLEVLGRTCSLVLETKILIKWHALFLFHLFVYIMQLEFFPRGVICRLISGRLVVAA